MKILITNVHPDDGLRVKKACEACGHEAVLREPRDIEAVYQLVQRGYDLIITFDGPWHDELRGCGWTKPIITVLGNNWLMAGHWRKEFERGRRWIVFKEPLLYWSWPDDRKAILPFVQDEVTGRLLLPDSHRENVMRCYIHAYGHRFHAAKQKAANISMECGIPIEFYGDDEYGGTLRNDEVRGKMQWSKWTIHIKHEGYMCNAPLKSLIHGTPVITDFETIKMNSAWSYLIPGVTCVAHDDPAMIAQMVKGMSEGDWRWLSMSAQKVGKEFNLDGRDRKEFPQTGSFARLLERAAKEGA